MVKELTVKQNALVPNVRTSNLPIGGEYFNDETEDIFYPPTLKVITDFEKINFNLCEKTKELKEKLSQQHKLAFELSTDRTELSNPNLFGWQNSGVRFILGVKRCILADEVGLGKTVQVIEAINLAKPESTLILVKKSLIEQWRVECNKWLSKDFNVIILNNTKTRLETFTNNLKTNKVVFIVNYEFLLKIKNTFKTNIDFIAVDEAHNFANRKAKRSIKLAQLARKSEYIVLMTGTPQEKNPSSLWSLVNIVNPRQYTSYWRWYNLFVNQNIYTYEETIKLNNLYLLHDIIFPFYIRRIRKQELPNIQEPQFITKIVKPTNTESRLYKKYIKESFIPPDIEILNGLTRLLYLRMISCGIPPCGTKINLPSKLEILIDLLEELSDKQTLILTSFREVVTKYSNEVDNCITYMGGQDTNNIEEFKSGRVKNLIATIPSVGEGTDLPNAQNLIFIDLPLSGLKYKQAVGRITRIGQEHKPLIYSLHHKGDIDEKIANMIAIKNFNFSKSVVTREYLNSLSLQNN